MKAIRLLMVATTAALIVFGLGGYAMAFHSGGVAHCDGCHTMHNSRDGATAKEHGHGAPGTVIGTAANEQLTIGSDPSSTCLNCHFGNGGYHIASGLADQVNYTAGGDFYWLRNDYVVDFGWTTQTLQGDNFGHNIIAQDFGYQADKTLTESPGGTYPAGALGCTSCHDPHGKVQGGGTAPIAGSGSYGDVAPADAILGNYRLLGDDQYSAPDSPITSSGYDFSNGAPIARALNGSSGGHYSEKVDYGSGMSEWCGNCHGGFLADGSTAHRHPAGNNAHLTGEYVNNYNQYIATGDMGGTDNYDGLVPIERGITDSSLLNPSAPAGADTNSNVLCLTCHRAHAAGFQNMARWDFATEIIGEEHHPTTGDTGYQLSDPNAGFYYAGASIDIATAYSPYQRQLCNKCHVQD